MNRLLLASSNPGKLVEMQAILDGMDVTLVTPESIGLHLEVPETGQTYAENAALKARAYAQASGMATLGDDSGLEVQALGGEPGLYSARYVPRPGATDADRRAYLLERLSALPAAERTGQAGWPARFCCTVAIATPDGQVRFADGECRGEIIPEERGNSGFGYDPIFYVPEYGQTMAELGLEVKNRISHRARALLAARPILQALFREK